MDGTGVLEREAARVALVDRDERVLLVAGYDLAEPDDDAIRSGWV